MGGTSWAHLVGSDQEGATVVEEPRLMPASLPPTAPEKEGRRDAGGPSLS
jgi:hypothetical protein